MELKIAILGTRGVPNFYGGFEHVAAHLATGLVRNGHHVTVYNSSKHPYRKKEWQGVRIVHCPDPENLMGVAGQFIYDLNCIRHARKENYDIILMLGYTSSSVWSFMYPQDTVVITNMDGLEWRRTKYSRPVRAFLKLAEKLAARSGSFHISDSPVIKDYLDHRYGINSKYIPYGACLSPAADETVLSTFGLKKHSYFLLMARMEPENNIETILDGFCLTDSNCKFVVVGNTRGAYGEYIVSRYKKENRISFYGPVFDERKVQSLTSFCKLYFHGHSVGGTNPSLLDAMSARAPLAAHRNPFTQSILKENALYFSSAADVCTIIQANRYSDSVRVENNYQTITKEFTWDKVIQQYENYFTACYRSVHGHHFSGPEKSVLYRGHITQMEKI